jgi:hypothetical protein
VACRIRRGGRVDRVNRVGRVSVLGRVGRVGTEGRQGRQGWQGWQGWQGLRDSHEGQSIAYSRVPVLVHDSGHVDESCKSCKEGGVVRMREEEGEERGVEGEERIHK